MLYIEQDLRQQFTDQLTRDERLVWAGMPRQGIFFQAYDKVMIPFSIAWCVIITIWMIFALESNGYFALFGIPFVLIGIFLLFGRFVLGNYLRARTYYALTTDRVIVKINTKRPKIRSFNLNQTMNIELIELEDERGTIIFGDRPYFTKETSLKELQAKPPLSDRFLMIQNARRVYTEIKKTQTELRRMNPEK